MMIRDRLERIRERAYALWERAGGGHGADEAHWHQASREVDDEDARSKPARKTTARKFTSARAKDAPAAQAAPKVTPKKADAKSAAVKSSKPAAASSASPLPKAGRSKPASKRATKA